ncbi:hypothetical protein Pmani_016031 [Petrolisthes manimaculis]|nr:hypothetical protein Pmani_016031 [Petrolisthes manimaculis]
MKLLLLLLLPLLVLCLASLTSTSPLPQPHKDTTTATGRRIPRLFPPLFILTDLITLAPLPVQVTAAPHHEEEEEHAPCILGQLICITTQ